MLTAVPEAEGGEAAGEVLGLAASRVGKQLYLPSALLAQHLPAGFGAMRSVPQLRMIEVESEEADEARATLGALEEATTQLCYASLAPEYERAP